MKTLKSYLNPKAQWHPNDGFPDLSNMKAVDTIKPILRYLNDNGFTELNYYYGLRPMHEQFYNQISKTSEEKLTKSYMYYTVSNNNWELVFCSDNYIDVDHPIYQIAVYKDDISFTKLWVDNCLRHITYKDCKEFKKEIDNYFEYV